MKVLQPPAAQMYDVIVVGGGPAGLSAALMLGRCRRRILLCDRGRPRNRRSTALHGYLTRDGIPPADFNGLGRQELAAYGVEFACIDVDDATRHEDGFDVSLSNGRREQSRFLLLATGVVDELPPIEGISECYGRSVFHCPYCDGWEWRDRRLVILGMGSPAVKLALSLRTWSAEVVLCTHGGRIARDDRERLARNRIALNTSPIARVEHQDGLLRAVMFRQNDALPCDAVFFTTGQYQQDDLAARLGCVFTRRGTVNTGRLCETNVAGVFVAGDASRDAQFVVVAAAEGVKAAVAINQALQREELVR